jgi:hypothetical protein
MPTVDGSTIKDLPVLPNGWYDATFDGEFDTEDVLEELLGNTVRLQIVIQTKGEYEGRNQVKAIKGPSMDLDEGDDEVDDN